MVTARSIAFSARFGCALALALTATAPAFGQEPSASRRLVWNEAWPRFRAWEFAATGALAAGGLALEYLTDQPAEPRWDAPILIDAPVRRVLTARTRSGRELAGILSDYSWITAQWYSQVVDALAVTLLADENFDVAWQMSWMNAQAMSLGFVLTRGAHRLVARSRALRLGCHEDPEYDGLCPFPGNTAGFPSGHASMAFVGAGLTCAHHQYLPLYGGGTPDLAACIGASAVATASGVLRLVADVHFVSDVIAGALLGFAVGYGLPVLLHYRFGAPTRQYDSGEATAPLGATYRPPVVTLAGSF